MHKIKIKVNNEQIWPCVTDHALYLPLTHESYLSLLPSRRASLPSYGIFCQWW